MMTLMRGVVVGLLLLMVECMGPAYISSAPAPRQLEAQQEVVVSGGEGTEVLVEGVAAVSGSIDVARDQALRDALRRAVEQGVGTYINSETRVQNFQVISDRIYSQATGYVASYRVISESREGELYRVVVRARVKLDRIEDDLQAIGILVHEQGRPRIMVVVKRVAEGSDAAATGATMDREVVETRIVARLQEKGFPVVDAATVRENLERDQLRRILAGDNQAAITAGLRSGAEIVIAGTMEQRTERRRIPYTQDEADFYIVRVSARAVSAQTAEVLGASVVTAQLPYSAEAAVGQAADSVSAELISRILAGWRRRLNLTQIHATNASHEKVERFKAEALARLRGVTAVIARELSGSEATIEIVSESTTQELFGMLGSRNLGISFSVTGFAGNRIDLQFNE